MFSIYYPAVRTHAIQIKRIERANLLADRQSAAGFGFCIHPIGSSMTPNFYAMDYCNRAVHATFSVVTNA